MMSLVDCPHRLSGRQLAVQMGARDMYLNERALWLWRFPATLESGASLLATEEGLASAAVASGACCHWQVFMCTKRERRNSAAYKGIV